MKNSPIRELFGQKKLVKLQRLLPTIRSSQKRITEEVSKLADAERTRARYFLWFSGSVLFSLIVMVALLGSQILNWRIENPSSIRNSDLKALERQLDEFKSILAAPVGGIGTASNSELRALGQQLDDIKSILSAPDRSNEATGGSDLKDLEQQLVEVKAILSAQFDNHEPTKSLDVRLSDTDIVRVSEALGAIEKQRRSSISDVGIATFVTGLAWWGFALLVSAPIVAIFLAGPLWKNENTRFLSPLLLAIGAFGSICAAGLLGQSLVGKFIDDSMWIVPPVLLGAAISTIFAWFIRQKGHHIGWILILIIWLTSILITLAAFVVILDTPEGCIGVANEVFSCKVEYLLSVMNFDLYATSFLFLVSAILLYIFSFIFVISKIFAGN